MKLIHCRVENYKCIEDSTEFKVDQVTCLVGKNEAGKTALLESLYRLNPVDDDESDFDELEYPRRFLATYRQRQEREQANILTTKWRLDDNEITSLDKVLGPGLILKPEVIIRKGYDNVIKWDLQINEKKLIDNLMRQHKLDAAERSQIYKADSILALYEKLESLENPSEKHKSLLNYLKTNYPENNTEKIVKKVLENKLPKFVYFDTYYKLPGKVALTDLKQREAQNNLEFEDKLFLALLDMTSSAIDDVENIDVLEKLIMELEAVQNSLTNHIFEYWTQNDHLEVEFRYDASKPKDPPPFNQGYIFTTRIRNLRHKASINFDERSSGFIWFFSFLVWFSQVKKNYGDNLFILLDEPGLSLHGKAQQDLLRYINEKLRPNYQVIYTAHSPFMIDVKNIFSLRTVEDVVERHEEDGQIIEKILGTKVGERILSKDRDTLFPLQGVLGFDIAQTLFVGPYVLVVEGPTEFALIHWFSRQLIRKNREGLDIRWAICPSEGANKISSFVTLFRGRGLKIVVLMDYHDKQKKIVDELEKSGIVDKGHLLKTTSYISQNEADIEDMLGRELYTYLVNHALNLPEKLQMPDIKPSGVPIRVVKETEDFCRSLPLGITEFTHYLPAQYLMGMSDTDIDKLPGLENALNIFEILFSDINKLI